MEPILDQLQREADTILAERYALRPRRYRIMPRTKDILVLVYDLSEAKGYAPTIRELQEAGGYSSTSVVAWHLRKLEAAGLITSEPGRSRTLHLTFDGTNYLNKRMKRKGE